MANNADDLAAVERVKRPDVRLLVAFAAFDNGDELFHPAS
jgi:hypothetical protein